MRLSHLLSLYRARLGARAVLVQEGFAIVGIAVGVALLFASQVASTSLVRSVQQLNTQIIGNAHQLQVEARGTAGMDERLLAKVRRLPGVQSALPVLEQPATVIGPRGKQSIDLLGTDPHFARAGGSLLRRFSSAQLASLQAIILPTPLAHAIGAGALETVDIQIGGRVVPTLLGATLGEPDIGGLVHSPVAIAPVRYAQQLTRLRGRITRIVIRPKLGREASVHAELQRLATAANVNLEPADFDSRLFAVAVAPQSKSEGLFSGISALVGFMFALNAMLVTVPARRALIEDIRPQGATRWMTVQIMLFDAAVIGFLACVIGLALGDFLSVAIFRAKPGYLSFAFPVGNQRIVTWQSVTLAASAGLVAAVVGVLWPLRDIIWRSVDSTQTSSGKQKTWGRQRLAIGLVCLCATTVTLAVRTQAAVFGNITLLVALICLLPLLFDLAVRAFDMVRGRVFNGAASALAVAELQAPQTRIRSLAIAATAAVAVFGIVEFQGTQANLQRGLDASAHGIDSSASVWVTPSGEANAFATTSFQAGRASALARLPGVHAVGSYGGSFLNWGQRRLWVLAQPRSTAQAIPPGQLVRGDAVLAGRRVIQGGWAVLSQGLADEHNLRVGQLFTLPAPRPITLRIAALSTNLGWPPGAIILGATDYLHAWGSNDPSAYQIQTDPTASLAAVRNSVQRTLRSEPGLVTETANEREKYHYALARQGLSRLTQIRLLVLVAAILAVSGAMGAMIWQRRDLVAFMKVDGYRRGVLWRWLVCESAILLSVGCSIGAVFGLYGQLLGSHFLMSVTGFPVIIDIEAVAALSSPGLVCLLAVGIVALPGYLVVRVPPSTVSPTY